MPIDYKWYAASNHRILGCAEPVASPKLRANHAAQKESEQGSIPRSRRLECGIDCGDILSFNSCETLRRFVGGRLLRELAKSA